MKVLVYIKWKLGIHFQHYVNIFIIYMLNLVLTLILLFTEHENVKVMTMHGVLCQHILVITGPTYGLPNGNGSGMLSLDWEIENYSYYYRS